MLSKCDSAYCLIQQSSLYWHIRQYRVLYFYVYKFLWSVADVNFTIQHFWDFVFEDHLPQISLMFCVTMRLHIVKDTTYYFKECSIKKSMFDVSKYPGYITILYSGHPRQPHKNCGESQQGNVTTTLAAVNKTDVYLKTFIKHKAFTGECGKNCVVCVHN